MGRVVKISLLSGSKKPKKIARQLTYTVESSKKSGAKVGRPAKTVRSQPPRTGAKSPQPSTPTPTPTLPQAVKGNRRGRRGAGRPARKKAAKTSYRYGTGTVNLECITVWCIRLRYQYWNLLVYTGTGSVAEPVDQLIGSGSDLPNRLRIRLRLLNYRS